MRRLLVFEDEPYNYVNDLFHMHLHDQLDELGVDIDQAINVRDFERKVTTVKRDVLVLDIMALAPEGFCWTLTGSEVPDALVGVELLHRCRVGLYGSHYKGIPIYMRTARGEADVRSYCREAGASDCFDPGADDMKLIEKIKDMFAVSTTV